MAMTPVQVRVLGCLIEKERVTPDNYPLTLNALIAACNQSSNRDPVVSLDEHTVSNSLLNLRGINLVRIVYSRSNRADRYRHVLDESLDLDEREAAILCLLMLRGPQTASELRARTERLHPFADQVEVDRTLEGLSGREEPLVACLDRQRGQRENRWAQLLGAELPGDREDGPSTPSEGEPALGEPGAEPALAGARDDATLAADTRAPHTPNATADRNRLDALEALREEVARLRADHDALVAELT